MLFIDGTALRQGTVTGHGHVGGHRRQLELTVF